MKTVVVCLLLVVITTAHGGAFRISQSQVIGTITRFDRLLNREMVSITGVKGTVQEVKYVYPKEGRGDTISCIKLIDKWMNGTNGELIKMDFNDDYRSTTLTLQSHEGFGISYVVEIWGHSKLF